MTQQTVTFAALASWLNADPQRIEDLGITHSRDDEDSPYEAEDVSYYLSECTDAFRDMMRKNGLWVSDDWNTLHFDPDLLQNIEDQAAAVEDALDGEDEDGAAELYGLSGDDSYDYNGSYITLMMDLIRAYLDSTLAEKAE